MIPIVFDTNRNFADKLYQKFNYGINGNDLFLENDEADISKVSCSKIAQATANFIEDNGENDSYVIFINIEGQFEGASHQVQKGMDILFWMRCKHKLVNPVVLYSFQSSASLLRQKPEHLLLHSEGTYHIRLPFDFENFKNKRFEGVEDLKHLKNHVKSAMDMELFRHRFANKWGVRRLTFALNECGISTKSMDTTIETKEEMIARFLYVDKDSGKSLNTKLLKEIKEELQGSRAYLHSKKILYLDDQAMKGWAKNFRDALNIQKENFISISDFTGDPIKDVKFLSGIIKYNKPDCILLDLRLKESDELQLQNNKYSGALLAEELKKRYVSLPIIMVTASNKAENLRIALRSGCETLWTKEGIDEYKGINYSLRNLYRLVNTVYSTCKKFETDEAKVNFESDVLLSKLESRVEKVTFDSIKKAIPELDVFEQFDVITADTNLFFRKEKSYSRTIGHIYLFLHLCRLLSLKDFLFYNGIEKFHFDDEVFLELLRFSKMDKDYEKDPHSKNLIERAHYICKKIYKWNNENLISYDRNPEIEDFGKKLHTRPGNDANYYSSNSKNERGRSRKEKKYKSDIHADEALEKYIASLVSSGKSILFINDDKQCCMNVGKALSKNGYKIVQYSDQQIVGKDKAIPKIIENSDRETVYRRMKLDEFHEIFDEVRKYVLNIAVLE